MKNNYKGTMTLIDTTLFFSPIFLMAAWSFFAIFEENTGINIIPELFRARVTVTNWSMWIIGFLTNSIIRQKNKRRSVSNE